MDEDLEFAAKAAGLNILHHGEKMRVSQFGDPNGFIFNPRHDDADAFRLFVTLQMRVDVNAVATSVSWEPKDRTILNEPHQAGDAYAAARECIFRAAVEIGRAL